MPENNLESLYAEAQQALKLKDNDRASDLLKQILVIDENYKDTSRLLARIVKEKRRRWYNDLRTWGTLGVLLLAGLTILIAPRLSSFLAAQPSSSPTSIVPTATTSSDPVITTDPTQTFLPAPTDLPPAWKRISMGQEFIRDTVTAIAVDPRDADVIYVGMQSAGIFKSIDGGNSWSPILEGLENAQVRALLIDPQAPDSLIAGTAGGVFKSVNGGSSWQWIADYGVQELLMDPQKSSHLYLGDGHLVYETTDGGHYWTLVTNDQTCPSKSGYYNSLEIDPRNGEVLYIATAGPAESVGGCQGVYRSTDRGSTWTRLGLNSASDLVVLQDQRSRTILMVSGGMEGGGKDGAEGLFVSMNEGLDWKFVQSYQCVVMETSSNYTDQLYCGVKTGGFYKTSSAGSARASGLSANQVTAIYADNYNGQERIIAGVEKNGLFISTDGGKSWSNQFGGLGATYLSLTVGKADGTRLYVNSQYGDYGCVLYRSDDRGSTWKLVTDTISEHYGTRISTCIPAVDPDDTLYAFPKMGLAKSKDGGEIWENIQIPQSEGQGNATRYVAANPYAPGPIYFLASNSLQVFLSLDSGKSWQASTGSSDHWEPRLFFTSGGQVIYSGNSDGRRQVSNDAGQTWSACAGETAVNKNSDSYLAIDPRNPGRLIYATSGNGIESSTDGCKSWQTANIGLTSRFFNSVAIDPNQPDSFYAGSDGGAYRSSNSGESWSEINDGLLGATVVYSIVVDKDSNIYAATPYGIFKLESK